MVGNPVVVTTIYALADPESGRCRYVGKTTLAVADRVGQHVSVARRSGRKTRVHCWIRSLLHRGLRPSILVLERINDGGEWEEVERTWIRHFRELGEDLTNVTEGGDAGCLGYRHTFETRQRMSLAQMGNTKGHACRGVKRGPLSSEHKRKLVLALTGRSVSQVTRQRISHAQAGRVFSEETRAKMSQARRGRPSWNKGRRLSPEHRAALSGAKLGKTLSPEHRAAQSRAKMGTPLTAEHRQALRLAWERRKRLAA